MSTNGATNYGDISPRTAAYAAVQLLERGIPYLVIEKFGQTKPVPQNRSKQVIFRRYEALDNTPNVLQEGVTPTAKKLTKTDITATLEQYGDLVTISDVILDTHEDPILQETVDILGEQAAQMIEVVRYGVLKAGTNVSYAGGVASRNLVDTVATLAGQRSVTRALKRQNARKITKTVKSTPAFASQNVAPSYVRLIHSDLETDVRGMAGYVPPESYGSMTPYESEIGKVEDCRYIYSTIFTAFADAGAAGAGKVSTSGNNNDVYPILTVGTDAYGIVPLKGKDALTPMVVNPKPSDSDPMAQRGHVAWKSMQTAVILNDLWMHREEVACSA